MATSSNPYKLDIVITPAAYLAALTLDYHGGFRYDIRYDSGMLALIEKDLSMTIGECPIDFVPAVIRKDTSSEKVNSPAKMNMVTSPSVGRKGSGVKPLSGDRRRFLPAVNPTMEALRNGRLTHHKAVLLGTEVPPASEEKVTARADEAKANMSKMLYGLPLSLPSQTGYNHPINSLTTEKERLSGRNLSPSMTSLTLALPVFRIKPENIPPRALEIIDLFIASHLRDLIYPQGAIQKVLQWIWIASDPDYCQKRSAQHGNVADVPFVPLSEWLRCAHLFETCDQSYQLAFYSHPFRFTNHMLRGEDHPIRKTFRLCPIRSWKS